MNKIILKKRTSAIFLAIVLVAGIIAISPPALMIGVHAESEDNTDDAIKKYGRNNDESSKLNNDKGSYGKDGDESSKYLSYEKDNYNSYYKSTDSNVIVKKINCNNINVNINGFNGVEFNAVPPVLNGLATEAQAANEGELITSSFGSGERNTNGYQHNDKDFKFVCINNNVVQLPPSPPC